MDALNGDGSAALDRTRSGWWFAPVLFVFTLLLYAGVADHDFVAYDDGTYVAYNEHVNGGLSAEGALWAIASVGYACNWHPLTWMSHMLDVSLFGTNAGAHHLHSAVLHALAAALLFLALRALTGAVWKSALVAAFFAFHPLRVESVAWIAERKDVLSGVLWMATLLAYAGWVKNRGTTRYALVVVLVALALCSKPMAVTLPCVLIVLDRWPLGRREPLGRLVREKLPLFVMSAASVVLTLAAQSAGGCTRFIADGVATGSRALNAAVAYSQYLGKSVLPTNLAVFYPHPAVVDPDASRVLESALALVVLVALSAGAYALRRRVPAVLAGWLWFLGTLVPVIGVVQVGGQACADRYAYVPLVGVYIALVWGGAALAAARPAWKPPLVGAALVALTGSALVTLRQIPVWKNTDTLFTHALDVTQSNYVAHTALGRVDGEAGRLDDARAHFEAAIVAAPRYYEAQVNLGWTYLLGGDAERALPYLETALDIRPEDGDAHYKVGRALLQLGRKDEARAAYDEAVRLTPDAFEPRLALGFLLTNRGEMAEAREHLVEARRIQPANGDVRVQLGLVLIALGEYDAAQRELDEASRLVPNHPGLTQAWIRLRERDGSGD